MGAVSCPPIFLLVFLVFTVSLFNPCSAAFPRKLALVQLPPVVLEYHRGPILKGNITVNLIWYGGFTTLQRSIIIDFLRSFEFERTPLPSVSSWWQTTAHYRGGARTLVVGNQFLDGNYSLGKSLSTAQVISLAARGKGANSIGLVLTAADVAVEGFCVSACGTHGSTRGKKNRLPYAWVGDPAGQCPGQCAWPFHEPDFGPKTTPLRAPNGDAGVDGAIISLATVLAGTVTNPFGNGYFQGPSTAPLEAVSACTGIFGTGAFPGYTGRVLVDPKTGASYNAQGLNGRKYLLPAMWDPKTSTCKTLV